VSVNEAAKEHLEEEVFGKRILVPPQDDWPIVDLVEA
jgi:hypothetical protein